jgi:hypothetical protein
MLVCYARELKEGFAEYAEEVVKIMVPHLTFYFHDGKCVLEWDADDDNDHYGDDESLVVCDVFSVWTLEWFSF